MKTEMMKIMTIVGEYVSLAIFGIGLFTVYHYFTTEFPFVWEIVTTIIFGIGAIWYFWEVVVKNFISGYRESSATAEPTKTPTNKPENLTADRL